MQAKGATWTPLGTWLAHRWLFFSSHLFIFLSLKLSGFISFHFKSLEPGLKEGSAFTGAGLHGL